MLYRIKRIDVPPGQRVLLRDVTWQEFETRRYSSRHTRGIKRTNYSPFTNVGWN